MIHPIVLGITGASGAIYAVRLLEVLRASGRSVHLSISPSGGEVIRQVGYPVASEALAALGLPG